MIRIKTSKPLKPITSSQFKTGVRRGLQNSKQYLVGNKGNNSGLIKQEMMKPKTGIIYSFIIKNRKTYYNHQASKIGGMQSSAILSGQLKRSVAGKVRGSDRLIISANTPYAKFQEKGGRTLNGAYIGGRKNLERPIKSSVGQIKNIIRREINK